MNYSVTPIRILSLLLILVTYIPGGYAKNAVVYANEQADFKLGAGLRFRPEFFWAKNITLLNNNNSFDHVVYARHIIDFDLYAGYGEQKYGWNIIEFKSTLRDRAIWGNPNSIAKTTEAKLRLSKTVFGAHKHDIPRHILWMRELWMRFDLNQALGLGGCHYHDLTLGSFPFELGRGIALGSAYAVGPEKLGFYSDSIVDQYAYGARLYGELIENRLSYDLYAAILQNKSSSFGDNAEEILGQQFGRRLTPQRGFGKINYIIAGRLNLTVFNTPQLGLFTLEPYALMNQDLEQKVEFLGDANSILGTAGIAGEFMHKQFEFGFDYAINFGGQSVKGWDRNQVEIRDTNSYIREFNSQIVDENGNKIPFAPDTAAGRQAQTIIDTAPQGEEFNGQVIGNVQGDVGGLIDPTLVNSDRRFRDPYDNDFQGWMFVADGGWWIYDNQIMLAATAGVASGDDNPNEDTFDRNYTGFIPLQEVYAGKRVKSAFLLSGSSKIKRPLSEPTTNQAPSRFALETNGFTNLVFTGAAFYWKPKEFCKEYGINPNILAYWQEKPTHKFDIVTRHDSHQFARTFLGVELNTFSYCYLIKDLKGFLVWSLFFPGGFFEDVRGKPLDEAQARELERYDPTGRNDPVPNLGTDIAFAFNVGLEYIF